MNDNENKKNHNGLKIIVVLLISFFAIFIIYASVSTFNKNTTGPTINILPKTEKTATGFRMKNGYYYTPDEKIYFLDDEGAISFKVKSKMEYVHIHISIYSSDRQVIKNIKKSYYDLNTTNQYNFFIYTDMSIPEMLIAKSYQVTSIVYKEA